MFRIYRLRQFILLVGIALSLSSCYDSDRDHDGLVDTKDKCPDIAAKTPDGCPAPKVIRKVHLYLDNSASMAGYFADSAAYKGVISNLAVEVNDKIAPLDISFIADRITTYSKDISHFPTDIATTTFAHENSSQLHVMADKIASQTGKNEVSILVSDCILSFPDDAIRANREINKMNASIVLKTNIYHTFDSLRNRGFGTSIYAFQSNFRGTYYNYQNMPMRLKKPTLRPYYVWVIAPKDMLSIFDQKLANMSSFKPQQALHFGLMDGPVSHYHILPQLDRAGHWKKMTGSAALGDQGLEDIEINNHEPVVCNATVDLSGLPAYASDIAYLKNNLQLYSPGCKASFTIKKKSEVSSEKIKSDDQRRSFENATHVIEVRIEEMRLTNTAIRLSLPLKYDTWYTDWSCRDDKQVTTQGHRTFAFDCLIEGLMQAFETKNANYIDLTFHLNP